MNTKIFRKCYPDAFQMFPNTLKKLSSPLPTPIGALTRDIHPYDLTTLAPNNRLVFNKKQKLESQLRYPNTKNLYFSTYIKPKRYIRNISIGTLKKYWCKDPKMAFSRNVVRKD